MNYSIQSGAVTIQFDQKPPGEVIGALKHNGFRWNGSFWWRRKVTGAADIIGAIEKLLQPPGPDAPCWECKSPDGFFRNFGAATPVLCDRCFENKKLTNS